MSRCTIQHWAAIRNKPFFIFHFQLRRHAKFDVAEPIHYYSVFAANILVYVVTLTFDLVTLTCDL